MEFCAQDSGGFVKRLLCAVICLGRAVRERPGSGDLRNTNWACSGSSNLGTCRIGMWEDLELRNPVELGCKEIWV